MLGWPPATEKHVLLGLKQVPDLECPLSSPFYSKMEIPSNASLAAKLQTLPPDGILFVPIRTTQSSFSHLRKFHEEKASGKRTKAKAIDGVGRNITEEKRCIRQFASPSADCRLRRESSLGRSSRQERRRKRDEWIEWRVDESRNRTELLKKIRQLGRLKSSFRMSMSGSARV